MSLNASVVNRFGVIGGNKFNTRIAVVIPISDCLFHYTPFITDFDHDLVWYCCSASALIRSSNDGAEDKPDFDSERGLAASFCTAHSTGFER